MGGGGNDAPEQSDEEAALMAQQTKILEQQLAMMQAQEQQFQMLAPFMFKDLGLNPIMKDGKITGFEEIHSETKDLREKSEKLLLERSVAALEGRLPVNPQLEQDLEKGKATLEESLRRSLGADFIASTSGSKAMADFEREKTNILESARRGDITLAEQLGMARTASNRALTSSRLGDILGVNKTGFGMAQSFGDVAAGFGNAAALWQNSRRLDMAGMQNQGSWTDGLPGIGSLVGTLATAPMTGGGSLFGNLFAA